MGRGVGGGAAGQPAGAVGTAAVGGAGGSGNRQRGVVVGWGMGFGQIQRPLLLCAAKCCSA